MRWSSYELCGKFNSYTRIFDTKRHLIIVCLVFIQKPMFSEGLACDGMKYRIRQPDCPL